MPQATAPTSVPTKGAIFPGNAESTGTPNSDIAIFWSWTKPHNWSVLPNNCDATCNRGACGPIVLRSRSSNKAWGLLITFRVPYPTMCNKFKSRKVAMVILNAGWGAKALSLFGKPPTASGTSHTIPMTNHIKLKNNVQML